jgi:hypothetical protein
MTITNLPKPSDKTLAALHNKLEEAKTARVPDLSLIRECEKKFISALADEVEQEMHRMRIKALVQSVRLDARYKRKGKFR